jgi:hypothetical protein
MKKTYNSRNAILLLASCKEEVENPKWPTMKLAKQES